MLSSVCGLTKVSRRFLLSLLSNESSFSAGPAVPLTATILSPARTPDDAQACCTKKSKLLSETFL